MATASRDIRFWFIIVAVLALLLFPLLGCGDDEGQSQSDEDDGASGAQGNGDGNGGTDEPDHARLREQTAKWIQELDEAIEIFRQDHHPRGLYPPDQGDEPYNTVFVVRNLQRVEAYEFSDEQLREVEDGELEIIDAWGNPLRYREWRRMGRDVPDKARNPTRFDLYSAGPDGEFGTADDIGNWSTTD